MGIAVCKTVIRQFKSGRYLQKKRTSERVSFSFGEIRTDRFENFNRNTPVGRCCHQFKNWWLPLFVSDFRIQTQTNLAGTSKNPECDSIRDFYLLPFHYSLFTKNRIRDF